MAEVGDHIDPSTPTRPPNSRRSAVRSIIGLALLAVAIVAAVWLFKKDDKPEKPQLPNLADLNDDPEVPVVDRNSGYLGPTACITCHASRVDEFQRTPHALACRRPKDAPMPDAFNGPRGRYVTGDAGLEFLMTRENGEYSQTAIQRTPAGERRSKSRIDLAYGANKADEVYFTWRGDKLYEHMVVWLNPSNQWANTSYHRQGSGEFVRDATTRCMECHNTWFEHVPGTANTYKKDSFILGVTCERCHGPGKEHVEFHRNDPKAKEAHAIVHPGMLSRERQIEVCTQCHGNSTKPRGPALSYRPGQPLEEYYRTAVTRYPEEDHVANQIKYLRQSKCFQKSESMTCVTCHDPHRPHEKADPMAGQKSCVKCHNPEACTDRPNLPVAVRDNCVACHMRQQVWMNVHFHTSTERFVPPIRRFQHRIAKDPIGRSEVLLAWHRSQTGDASRMEASRLSKELAKHWLGESESRRREYRFLGAIGAAREVLLLDPDPEARQEASRLLSEAITAQTTADTEFAAALFSVDQKRIPRAIDTLDRILKIKPNWGAAHSKLGTLLASTGRVDRALEHLQSVARYDPDNASGFAMLGWLAYLDDRPHEAIEFYQKAEQIEPFDAKINYHWGLALLKLGQFDEASVRFRKVLLIDPGHAGGCQGLAHALRLNGQAAEAVRYALRAGRLTHFEQQDVLVTMAEVYSDADRPLAAAAAATKAIELDANSGPGLAIDVRHRLMAILSKAGH